MRIGKTIGIIGCGNMGEALLKGILTSGQAEPGEVRVSGPHRARLDELAQRHGVQTSTDNTEVARASEVVIFAVKPQILDRVLEPCAPHFDRSKLAISVAAGVSSAAIERWLPSPSRVVRAMPNVAALVGESATGIAAGRHASPDDLRLTEALFNAIGRTVVLDEGLLDAVTGLSGSGPAYIFLIIEALSDAGVKVGLSRATAQNLAAQTVLGAAKLLLETGLHPGQLKDMVTSPGGTAITGLHTLEAGGLRTTLINAVEAATHRAKELGQLREGPNPSY